MATHAQNISNLENAVFGEQVRRSMVELFEEDYALVKKAIGFGTDINSPTSSTVGYYDGNLYINSDTMDIWEMDGYGWHIVGNVKSIKDITVVESQLDDGLNTITITLTDGTTKTVNIKNGSKGSTGIGVTDAVDNGDGTFSLKLEDGTITPSTITTIQGEQGEQGIQGIQGIPGKGVTSITSIDAGKNHTLVANFTDGTSNNITTLRDGTDGTGSGDMTKATYDVNDNGIVDYAEAIKDNLGNTLTYAQLANKAEKATTLSGYGIIDGIKAPETEGKKGQALITDGAGGRSWGDVSSLIDSVNESEFKVTDKKLSLASDVTKKLPNTVPTSADAGFAPVVQSDGSVKWQKVSGGGGAVLGITCTPGEYVCITDTTGTTPTIVYDDICASGEMIFEDIELLHTYILYQHNADRTKQSAPQQYKAESSTGTIVLSYFTAYIDIAGDPNLEVSATNGTSTYSGASVTYDGSKYIIRVGETGTYSVTATKGKATRTVNNITVPNTPNSHTTAPALQSFGYVMVDASSDFATPLEIVCKKGSNEYDKQTYNGSPVEFVFADAGNYTFEAIAKDSQIYSLDVDVVLGETLNKTIETKATIELNVYSASNDTIVVTKGGESLGTCVTDASGKGTFTVSVLPSGENIKFTSTDIDKVDGSSGKYEVTVNIAKGHTAPIKVMPEGALFWYGYVDDRIEDMADSDWVYGTRGYSKRPADFSTLRKAIIQAGASSSFSGIGSKITLSGYTKASVIITDNKEAEMLFNDSKNLDVSGAYYKALTNGKNTQTIGNDKYVAIYATNGRHCTVSAWWLE